MVRQTVSKGSSYSTSHIRSAGTSYLASVESSARILMWVLSFTFKYLPNIIQKFCMHAAVRECVR